MQKFEAHQRVIRERLKDSEPRQVAQSLVGYTISTITRAEAVPIILKYEWLGTIGSATEFIGLISPHGEIQGVACFGWGPAGPIRALIGGPALCLERGACVHYAPRNSASFLINGACKLVYRITGTARFFAYADPMAGEYGAVYQAAGWAYLGRGLDGKKGRPQRYFVLRPGRDPNDPSAWQTTRVLRQGDIKLVLQTEARRAAEARGDGKLKIWDAARALGWRIEARDSKHVYAIHVGRDRKCWRRTLSVLTYPCPRGDLKLKSKPSDPDGENTIAERVTVMEEFRRIAPINLQASMEL